VWFAVMAKWNEIETWDDGRHQQEDVVRTLDQRKPLVADAGFLLTWLGFHASGSPRGRDPSGCQDVADL
jgi:hypothetical protein